MNLPIVRACEEKPECAADEAPRADLTLPQIHPESEPDEQQLLRVCNSGDSLQEAFLKFRKDRIRQKQERKAARKRVASRRAANPEAYRRFLRQCFVVQAKKYLGVPYAAKYHDDASEHFNAPLYLDCCGLVRRVLLDLEDQLGFRIGPWNQAYLWDTLRGSEVASIRQLQVGDLIFYQGKYVDDKKHRPQKFDMVHVEIYMGDDAPFDPTMGRTDDAQNQTDDSLEAEAGRGDTGSESAERSGCVAPESGVHRTLGARHRTGVVQFHPSYAFKATAWTCTGVRFCKIDPWLDGKCFPTLPEYQQSFDTLESSSSVFYQQADAEEVGDQQTEEAEAAAAEAAATTPQAQVGSLRVQCDPVATSRSAESTSLLETRDMEPKSQAANLDSFAGSQSPAKAPKTFYVNKANGWRLVASHLQSLGWEQLGFERGSDDNFDLRWVEARSSIDYDKHAPGQLVNHIENNFIVTRKTDLVLTLESWWKGTLAGKRRLSTSSSGSSSSSSSKSASSPSSGPSAPSSLPDYMPRTFLLRRPADCVELLRFYESRDSSFWIVKPRDANRGRGLFMTSSQKILRHLVDGTLVDAGKGIFFATDSHVKHLEESSSESEDESTSRESQLRRRSMEKKQPSRRRKSRASIRAWRGPGLVQRYIARPVLFDRRVKGSDKSFPVKFDLRCFALVARTSPLLVLGYPGGYARGALEPFYLPPKGIDLVDHKDFVQRRLASMGGDPAIDVHDSLRFAHLTNASVQKHHRLYKEESGASLLSWAELGRVLSNTPSTERPSVWTLSEAVTPCSGAYMAQTLQPRLFEIMADVLFRATKDKWSRREGAFDLFGFDFMLDNSKGNGCMAPVLIEVNTNPALLVDCAVLQDLLPKVVAETLDVVIAAAPRPRQSAPTSKATPVGKASPVFRPRRSAAGSSLRGPPPSPAKRRHASFSPSWEADIKARAGAFVLLGDEQTGYSFKA